MIVALAFTFVICIICFAIGSMPFSKEYKESKKHTAIETLLILLMALLCFIFTDFKIAGKADFNFLYSIGGVCTLALIIIAIREIVCCCVIYKQVKSGKALSEITPDDIPKTVRMVFNPFYGIAPEQDEKQGFMKKFLKLMPFAVVLAYMVGMFGVYELYFANVQEWRFNFWDLLIPSLVALAAGIAIAAVLALVLRGRSSDIAALIMAAVSVLAYVQANFLNEKTFMDGSALKIEPNKALFNVIIWLTVCCAALYCYRQWTKAAVKAAVCSSLLLLVMQIVPLPYMLINGLPAMNSKDYEAYSLDGRKQFEVSSDENVIVFIMDTFYNGYLDRYIEEHPESTETLSDFTLYNNVTTTCYHTAFSMPSILTNHDIDFTVSLADSNAAAWNSAEAEDFYGQMQENGYKIRLYTDSDIYCGDAKNMAGKIDNAIKYKTCYVTQPVPTYLSMLKLSLYRYSPDAFKHYFYISESMLINQYSKSMDADDNVDLTRFQEVSDTSKQRGICFYNSDFYQSLKQGLSTDEDGRLCVFYHLSGMHPPYTGTDSSGQYIEQTESESLDDCISIFAEYISQMKEMGIYDSSTIILTADHGLQHVQQSTPVMLVKPAGASKDSLTVNEAPGVLQNDLLPTILECVGLKSTASSGYSLLSLDENMDRTRIVRQFNGLNEFPPAPKCSGIGTAQFNCYMEYSFTGRLEDYNFLAAEPVVKPITDYWF